MTWALPQFESARITARLDELAYLNPGLRLTFVNKQAQQGGGRSAASSADERKDEDSTPKSKLPVFDGAGPYEFCHKGGLQDLVEALTNRSTPLYTDVHTIAAQKSKNGIEVDVALRWMKDSYSEEIVGTLLRCWTA